jgi:LysM repeat protein
MLTAILVLVLAYAVLHSIIPKVSANNEQVYIEHIVEAGETLYSISRMYRPDQDWRKTSYEIQKASGCTALIRPGQVLLVPVK